MATKGRDTLGEIFANKKSGPRPLSCTNYSKESLIRVSAYLHQSGDERDNLVPSQLVLIKDSANVDICIRITNFIIWFNELANKL